MASIINSDDGVISGTAGLKSTGANDGALNIQTNGTNAITVSSSQAVAINGNNISADNSLGFRNRVINGDMRIDQRNAGASVTITTNHFITDRWNAGGSQSSKYTAQQNAGSVTPPAGFTNYLGATSSSAYSITASDYFLLLQTIEGYNIADFNWGTANAKTVTLSFWVRSSLTGTFGGALRNGDTGSPSYPFTYTISSANTWEYKTITAAGPTTGTWNSTNGNGLQVWFSLGVGSDYSGTAGSWAAATYFSATGATSVVGTNGATFYITGVQLEVGSVATPFERRDYGRELIMCQRYYYRIKATAANKIFTSGAQCYSTTGVVCAVQFPVTMRTDPSALEQSGTAGDYRVYNATGSAVNLSSVLTFSSATTITSEIIGTVSSGLVAGNATTLLSTNSNAYLGWSAEL